MVTPDARASNSESSLSPACSSYVILKRLPFAMQFIAMQKKSEIYRANTSRSILELIKTLDSEATVDRAPASRIFHGNEKSI